MQSPDNITLLGTGVLSWNAKERRSDRYGAVGLFGEPDYDEVLMPMRLPQNQYGKLVAEITEVRQSGHIGDFTRGIFPNKPKVGDRIILGEGLLFYDQVGDWWYVGLKPTDNRRSDWLDPNMLYRAHDQTVNLYFERTELEQ